VFEFGQEVKDIISGFKGIVTGKCSYITGCEQFLVQPKSKKTDSKPDAVWFDIDRLQSVGKKIIKLKYKADNGCDLEAPNK
jgi:hypothetical protein